ncbi:nitroreductase [Motilibacter rhizosphaerae]|uniref:Nitroreductase n=1 Tax=Motilibacter rhizosphaerae TaxID=598652 RepID=A0A4Q7NSD5_9ACTN|nr:nitroreductase family protein [Motilibacter rhizosphaerae]RZS90007.1 nitroreductase [Motilibacter rhizosphaerae]
MTSTPQLHPLLLERRSPRAYDAVSRLDGDVVTRLLEAARWAPSAMNRQPWRFLVGLRDDETFKGVFDALAPGNQTWAGSAGALVVALAPVTEGDKWTAYELGLAVGQLTVQAHAEGLFVHQMGGFDAAQVKEGFGVPEGYEAYAVLAVGTLGDVAELPEHLQEREVAPRERLPLGEIAFSGSWGSPLAA